MRANTLKQIVGAALGVYALTAAVPAVAADEALLQLLKTLKDSGTITQQAYDQLLKSAKVDAEKNARAQAQVEQVASQANTPVPKVSFGPGLKVQTQDGAFSFKVGGRIFIDGGFMDETLGKGQGSNTDFRRARLEVQGKAWKWWEYKLQYDFANGAPGAPGASAPGGTGLGTKAGFRDAYIALRYFNPVTIQVGSEYEPFGLEIMTSSKYIDFIERAIASDGLTPNRHIGAAVGTHGEDWTAKGGIFSTSFEDKAGSSAVVGGNQYYDVTGRFTYAPIHTSDTLLHFGASVRYEQPNDSNASTNDRVLAIGGKPTSEANILGLSLLASPDMSCGPTTLGKNCTNDIVNYGFESAAAWGPFSLQGEFMGIHYNRNAAKVVATKSALLGNGADVDYFGYYVYANWYLTGESRATAYELDDYAQPASFGQEKILRPFSEGGPGAWSLGARLSGLDLNDSGAGVRGGRQQDVTVGVNWNPDPGFRLMANWINVFDLAAPASNKGINQRNPNIFIMRAQVHF